MTDNAEIMMGKIIDFGFQETYKSIYGMYGPKDPLLAKTVFAGKMVHLYGKSLLEYVKDIPANECPDVGFLSEYIEMADDESLNMRYGEDKPFSYLRKINSVSEEIEILSSDLREVSDKRTVDFISLKDKFVKPYNEFYSELIAESVCSKY